MGQVGPGGEPPPGLQPLAERQPAVGHVEQAVVGVRLGPEVPGAQPLGVHHRHHATPPPRAPGDHVGHEPVLAAVDERPTQVDREAHGLGRPEPRRVAGTAERAAQVAAEQPEHGQRLPRPPGRLDHGAGGGVGADHHAVGRQGAGAAPGLRPCGWSCRIGTGHVGGLGGLEVAAATSVGPAALASPGAPPTALDAATTPRNSPRPRPRRLAGVGPIGVVGDLAQQVDQQLGRCARSRRPAGPRRRARRRAAGRPPRRGRGRRTRGRAGG